MITTRAGSRRNRQMGYSLAELLIAVAILGILASISVSYVSEIWKGQLAIANLENMRSWLESVRRASLRGQACTVKVSSSNLRDGSIVLQSEVFNTGTVESTPCGSPVSVSLESPYNKEHYLLTTKSGSTSIGSFVLTPRGTLFKSATTPAFTNDIVFNLSITNSNYSATSKSYCLRMSAFLGTIQAIGSSAC